MRRTRSSRRSASASRPRTPRASPSPLLAVGACRARAFAAVLDGASGRDRAARRRARVRRLVVGKRAARRARPQRARSVDRHRRARAARGHRAAAPQPLPRARARRGSALRLSARPRGRAARAAVRAGAAAGRARLRGRDRRAAARSRARLRRANVAPAQGHPRRPARRSLARGRERRGGLGAVADRLRARVETTAGARSVGRARGRARRRRARRRPGGVARACATASARPGSTTCSPCPARTSRSSPAARCCSRAALGLPRLLGEVGALVGIAAYVLAVGAQPSVIRAGVVGALGSLAWIAARQRDRWHFLLLAALRAARVEPVHAARRGLSALVRRRRVDLPVRPAAAARARGLSAPALAGGGDRRVDGLRRGDRAGAVAPVPRGAAARGAGERARRARDGAAARAGAARGAARPGRARCRGAAGGPGRLVRRVARAVRAPRRRAAVRAGQLVARRPGARRRLPSSPRPMLGGDGGAQAGLPDLGQRPAEDPGRARASPQPLRGGRRRGARRARAPAPTTRSPPATRSASSAARGGS